MISAHTLARAAEEVDELADSDDEEDGGEGADGDANLATTMALDEADDAEGVKVTEIDAYWLQRAIAEAYSRAAEALDAPAAQTRATKVLALLADATGATELESQLVDLLGFDRFQLIKVGLDGRRRSACGGSATPTAALDLRLHTSPPLPARPPSDPSQRLLRTRRRS